MYTPPSQKHIISSDTCAGIVVYNPDAGKLRNLIQQLSTQVDCIFVYDNGGLDQNISTTRENSATSIKVLGAGENVGISEALNDIFNAARSHNYKFIASFDQDSSIANEFIVQLRQNFLQLNRTNKIAAVAPIFIDARSEGHVFPVFQIQPFWIRKIYPADQDTSPILADLLITSGTLTSLDSWQAIGEFLGDMFIDHVDSEWCLRARARGYGLAVCPSIKMDHELSDDAPRRVLGRLVLIYSPIRRYYAFRNTIRLIGMSHTPRGLKIYLACTLLYRFFINTFVDKSMKSIRAMLKGVFHGLIGRAGKIDSNAL